MRLKLLGWAAKFDAANRKEADVTFLQGCLLILFGASLGYPVPQAQRASAVLNVTEDFLRDRITQSCNLAYPLLHRARQPGYVVLKLVVDETGRVSSKEVLAGHKILDGAAKDCVDELRFDPPTIDAMARRMSGLYTVRFDIVKDAPLFGEELPFIQALNDNSFIIEGKEMALSGLLQWLKAEHAASRFRKVRLRVDSVVDINRLTRKLREAGVHQVCLFDKD